jgi:hypothetical protein
MMESCTESGVKSSETNERNQALRLLELGLGINGIVRIGVGLSCEWATVGPKDSKITVGGQTVQLSRIHLKGASQV